MRKILTRDRQKSKDRFNQILVGLVLVFLMMLSIVGYSLTGKVREKGTEEKIVYNEIEFVKKAGYWTLNVENYEFVFRYNPEEVNKSDSQLNYLNTYFDKPLYIESDYSDATVELYMNMNQIVQRIQPACLNASDCEGDIPVKDCNSTFIIIQESNTTSIEQNASCVFISAPAEELVATTDEFLFKILGIEG